ncbi:hypothetical protein LDENG_00286040 [Lucifuga dentata]|nr:hypothetical protein LDENG_00286040 [Lucifuga dentata]
MSAIIVSSVSSVVTRRREQRVLVMVVTMVACYLVCWLPYGVVALLSTFGPPDLVTPEASITPSLMAKFSTVVNPFIYIFMNKQFYLCFREFLKCPTTERSSTFRTASWVTLRQGAKHKVSVPPAVAAPPIPDSTSGSKEETSHMSAANPPPIATQTPAAKPANSLKKVVLVAEYWE